MRVALVVVVAALATAGVVRTVTDARPGGREAVGSRTPVLVELFTSEGCSSCPPADRLLAQLVSDQPVTGADVIVLSEHVDYWDRLGWRDPFSSSAFTERQRAYARAAFGADRIYTPQMVVGGRDELIGSDRAAATAAIERAAARAPQVSVELTRTGRGADLSASVRVAPVSPVEGDADVLVAVVEDGLTSAVRSGENAGRRLSHTAVVRALVPAGRIGRRQPSLETVVEVPVDPAWSRQHVRLVAFVQDAKDLHVLGVAPESPALSAAGEGR